MNFLDIVKVFSLGTVAFVLGRIFAPSMLSFLEKFNMRKKIREESTAPVFAALHKAKTGTLNGGGILIWGITLFLIIFVFILSKLINDPRIDYLNFLSRKETWLPLGALIGAATVGFIDDYVNVRGLIPKVGGITVKWKIVIYTLISLIGAYWFYFKLGFNSIHVPFVGDFVMGLWYIPFFMFTVVATTFSVNEIDGLDGLAGGTIFPALMAYAFIALTLGKVDLATFVMVLVGALLAFLWENVPPAKVFMGDTGSVAIGITLGVVALLTNYSLLLPIFGFLLVVESMSVILQKLSKKFLKKKIWLSTPIHHHFQAKGMAEHTITMKFWIIGFMSAVVGLVLFFLDRNYK